MVGFSQVLPLVLILLLLGAAAYGARFWVERRQGQPNGKRGAIDVLAFRRLSPHAAVAVVRYQEVTLVVGVNKTGMCLLKEMSGSTAAPETRAPTK
jgi:flagellar biogenesis protein FliO